jgi:hypothetical protein
MIITDPFGQQHTTFATRPLQRQVVCATTATGCAFQDILPTEAEPEKTLYDQAQ